MIRRYSRNYNAGYFEESELVDSVESLVKSKFGENAELYANYWAIGKDGVEVGDGYMEKSEARQEARAMGLEISGVKAICEVWTPDNKYGPKLRTEGSTLRQALSAMKKLVNTKSASRLSHRRYATSEESTARVGAQIFSNIWKCIKAGRRVENCPQFDQMVDDVIKFGLAGTQNLMGAQNWVMSAADRVDELASKIERFGMKHPMTQKAMFNLSTMCGQFNSNQVGHWIADEIERDLNI